MYVRVWNPTCGKVGWLPTCWVDGKDGGFKKLQEVGSLLDYLTAGEKALFYCLRVGQLSRYSQVQLLHLGAPPPMLRQSFPNQ